MRIATKSPTGPRMGSPAPYRLPRSAGQSSEIAPVAPAPAPAPTQAEESLEGGWLRVTSMTREDWLSTDEGQRRFRLQAAATISGTSLSSAEREELLQKIDAHCAAETGQPAPVYRGVPATPEPEAPAAPPVAAGSPYDVPSAGAYRSAGEADSGPGAGTLLAVAGATLAAAALISQMTDTDARANPGPKRKKSWWDKLWGGGKASSPKKRKKASGAKRRVRRSK